MNTALPYPHSNEKGGYPLSPTTYWVFCFSLVFYGALPLLIAFEIILEIRVFLLRLLSSPSHNSPTSPKPKPPPQHAPQNNSHLLQHWLTRPSYQAENYHYVYPTRRSRLEVLLCSAFFSAYTKIATLHIWLDPHPHMTAFKLKAIVKQIRQRAQASEKFRLVFEKLLHFLADIDASSPAAISSFIRKWSMDMAANGNVWYIKFGNRRTNCTYVPQTLYEATLATFALFHARGGGVEAYYISGRWKEEDRRVYGALTLLLFFAFDKCYPEPSSTLVRTKRTGLEQILLVNRDLKFVRVMSCISSIDERFTKNLFMWDITRNCCNEFVESSWSVSCFERVIWTLEHGLRHVSVELYDSLKGQDGQRRVDMTHLNALSLMTLSVAGLVRFRGMGDGPYQIVSRAEAMVEVHGQLPGVTIKDLVELKLVDKMQGGRFCMRRLPGCDRRFKAISVGDKIKFVASAESECFNANTWQQVL